MSEEVSGVLSVPNKPSGFCGRKAVFTYLLTYSPESSRDCVSEEVSGALPSLISPTVSVDVKQYLYVQTVHRLNLSHLAQRKHGALRPQKPLRLIRDGEVEGSGIFKMFT